mgnify:CR=1 FL=1
MAWMVLLAGMAWAVTLARLACMVVLPQTARGKADIMIQNKNMNLDYMLRFVSLCVVHE